MRNYRDKLQQLGWGLYYLMAANFLWWGGLLLGLIVFAYIPATITIFQLFAQLKIKHQRERLKLLPFWRRQYVINVRKYAFLSWFFVLIQVAITMAYAYLAASVGTVTYLLFYVAIVLWLLWLLISLWFCYLAADHPDKPVSEIWRNAILYPLAHLVEMVIILVFLAALFLLLWPRLSGLVVFIGSAGCLWLLDITFTKIMAGYAVRQLFKDWRRQV